MTGCQGKRGGTCDEPGVHHVSVLDPGRETSGDYCRPHASSAIVRTAMNGQRVVVVKDGKGVSKKAPMDPFAMPSTPIMVSGDTSEEFAEWDSLSRR